RTEPGQDERANNRVRHAAARLADRPGHMREEIEIQRLDTLSDHEEQDEGQGHERHEHGQRAESDEERRDGLPAERAVAHAAASASGGAARGALLRAMLQMRSRDNPLMTSVITNSTNPTSIRAAMWRSVSASVNSLSRTAAIVYCGAKSEAEILGLLPMTIVTAIVSPSARPKPSITAPTMPVRAKKSAARIASKRVAPSAYAPSRCAAGTAFSTSRATDEVNGITMTARISPAASMPTPSGGPLKSGNARSPCGNDVSRA